MIDFLSEIKWLGEFFPKDRYEQRFIGEVTYSPEYGLILAYHISGEVPDDCYQLDGVFVNGDRCTLIGPFSLQGSGRLVRNRVQSRSGRHGIQFLIIGQFLPDPPEIKQMSFTITGLQDFFEARGREDFIKFSETAVYSANTNFGKLEVRNVADFSWSPDDITSYIHSPDSDALSALQRMFEQINTDFPKALFMIKKDIQYRFLLKFDVPVKIEDGFNHVVSISDLFALLSYNPVIPLDVQFFLGRELSLQPLKLYAAMTKNRKTLELCKQANERGGLPIRKRDLQLDSVLVRWLSHHENFDTVISSVQGQTGYTDLHSSYGDIVLYATQLEKITQACSEPSHRKYEFPLTVYASIKNRNRLLKLFSITSAEKFGKALSELRGELTHISRNRSRLAKISLSQLGEISQCLELIVISYIMEMLGVARTTIIQYQDTIIPD